jgi:prevent-host-death family protein
MLQLQTIGAYEAKAHFYDLLQQVRAGQGFTITQSGEPVADLLPVVVGVRRAGAQAAARMQRFMADAPKGTPCDAKSLMDDGRD